jgi:hypothetical protein
VRSRISVPASDMEKGKGGARTPSNAYILAAHSLGINPCDALPRDIGPKDAGHLHPTVHDALAHCEPSSVGCGQ